MGKWHEVDDIKRPAADVAADILGMRVQEVTQRLPLAAHNYREDVEHVHQLRVGCRRAGAALESFKPLLPSVATPLKACLRKVRRAAGPARDIDVLLERLQDEASSGNIHEFAIAQLNRRRQEVQDELIAVSKKAKRKKLKLAAKRCIQSLRKRAQKSKPVRFDRFAREALRKAGHGMFQSADLSEPSVDQLHQLRIAGKRLRYSIELFHAAFPATLRDEIYPLVEDIQSRLGDLNDHVTAQAMYQGWLAALPPDERAADLADQIRSEYDATISARADFLKWWNSQRVAQLQTQLTELTHE